MYRMIEHNTRFPVEMMGDINSQIGGCLLGRDGVAELIGRFGIETFLGALEAIWDQSEAVSRAARHAEDLGFRDVWVSDPIVHPAEQSYPSPFLLDPFATLSWAAAVTTRVRLGTSVLVVPGSRIAQPDYVGAYGVDLAHAPAPLIITATAKDGIDAQTLEAGLLEVLDGLATESVTVAELDRAKALLTTSWWRQLSTVGGRADTLSRYATQFGDASSAGYQLPAWQSVTAADVAEAAALALRPSSRVTLTYLPGESS